MAIVREGDRIVKRPGLLLRLTLFMLGMGVLAVGQFSLVVAADAPRAATCKAYDKNTELSDTLIVPAMLAPCAPGVSESGASTDIVANLQHGFDLYSWLTFVALNSPADGKTALGSGPRPKGDAPTAWESYKQLPDLMKEDGKPASFDEPVEIPKECGGGVVTPGTLIVHIAEETFNQPFKTGPLIDQNGNYALFVIFMNREMYDFIIDSDLHTRAGQRRFQDKKIEFPMGDNGNEEKKIPPRIGALMIKASWKILKKGEEGKFHAVNGLIYTPGKAGSRGTCVHRTLGLIGFHVAHKTTFNPQWVWTTFEHRLNVPEERETKGRLSKQYSFFNPSCDRIRCPVNEVPKGRWDPAIQPYPEGFRSQIVRVIPVTDDAKSINARALSVPKIKGTVWENYMLVSTQWPTDFRNPVDLAGVPAPTFLANTTLETYSQGTDPQASSSCIGCHLNATTARAGDVNEQVKFSDFTYILEKAH